MARVVIMIGLVLVCGCGKKPFSSNTASATGEPSSVRRPEMDDFFIKWLEGHGHKDVVVDKDGIGIATSPTRLQAGLYGSKRQDKGGYIVEVEFTIRLLPSQRTITEFVAGTGETEEKAIGQALANFTLTTFHVVYKGFMNAADPHVKSATVSIKGANREVIGGDLFMLGNTEKIDLAAMRAEIQGALKDLPLTPEPHWLKVVYGQKDGNPLTVAVTLDNADQVDMTNAVKRLNWPHLQGFYVVKQFIVVK
jgi:hypothetical protein